ncbi:hypothetical protein FXW07_07205 [Methanosarcina sp. DH1]|uniref:hypothetical protein n=1 Tax=Methanosarcina sp. DH1 TaxID=2605695 RepID=UPI001E5CB9B7|nr:hypothetical protein [Methanosarcina sp. DH1]MCC4766407.1 hypothetical protein [Methanosarcina sp. DH1]
MTTIIEIAAAQVLGCDVEDVEKLNYDHFGMDVYTDGSQEYAIGLDEEASQAARDEILESLWAFNAEFILSHSKAGSKPSIIKALKQMQESLCEDANELIRVLITDLDQFVEDAISSDGRGNFLSPYDNEEQEININGIIFYCYRLN